MLHPALTSQLISGDTWLWRSPPSPVASISIGTAPSRIYLGLAGVYEADVGLRAPATSLMDPRTPKQTLWWVLIPDPELCALWQTSLAPAEHVSHTSVASRSWHVVSSGTRGSCELGSREKQATKLWGIEE